MKYMLDFSLVAGDGKLAEYSEGLRSRLKAMPATLERANSAVMFAELADRQKETWVAAAYVRAALAEFCAMGEMQEHDRRKSNHVQIGRERNPLLHVLVLLRHLNIHVKTMAVGPEHLPIEVDGLPIMVDGLPLCFTVLVVSNLSSLDLASLQNGKNYDVADLDRCVAWFNRRQLSTGVSGLITQGVALFAELICDRHGLTPA